MAGIGPICMDSRDVLKRAQRRMKLKSTATELEIFYNLCAGKVLFRERTLTLYFVDSPVISVTDIIHSVFMGLNQQPCIEQRYMDKHQLIKAAFCITLTTSQKMPLLVALRLRGVHIDHS